MLSHQFLKLLLLRCLCREKLIKTTISGGSSSSKNYDGPESWETRLEQEAEINAILNDHTRQRTIFPENKIK